MAYPSPTEINWTKGAGESVNYLNVVTNGIFSSMLIMTVYIIVLWGSYRATKDIVSAFAITGFANVIVGLIMWIGGWLTWITFGILLGLEVLAVAVLLLSNK